MSETPFTYHIIKSLVYKGRKEGSLSCVVPWLLGVTGQLYDMTDIGCRNPSPFLFIIQDNNKKGRIAMIRPDVMTL